jgi:hypothetical protein
MGGARSPNYRQGQPQNVTEQYHQFGDKMRQEMSLRGLARALGYSVATLSEHRNAGIFRALPNGKYDLEAVVKGLLASTSPTAEHRTKLETQTVRQTAKSRTWEDWARKLEGRLM